MRAIATALVLIIGAAIVLWYGNTLNSWVLGGLIGGLAALLLSIPLSLVIFTYFARRHEDHERALEESEQTYYEEEPVRRPRVVESTYMARRALPSVRSMPEFVDEEEAEEVRVRAIYHQRQIDASRTLPTRKEKRSGTSSPRSQQTQSGRDSTRGGEQPSKRITRKMSLPGTTLGEMQSAALRAARMEATQRFDENYSDDYYYEEDVPSRRSSSMEYLEENFPRRPARSVNEPQEPMPNVYPRRPRRRPQDDENTARSQRRQNPDTDYLREECLQTDQIDFPVRKHKRKYDDEMTTDSLQRPLVRRAPYLYEDDPLRQELAQYVDDEPITRRSSALRRRKEDR